MGNTVNKQRLLSFLLAAILVVTTIPCFAAEDVFLAEKTPVEKTPCKDVLKSSIYGGLAGTLVGAAMLAFTRKPGDHLDRMAIGATAGALMGAGYGVVKATRSLAEVEDGKVKFAMPTIMPDIKEPNSKGQTAVIVMAEFLRGTF